MKCTENKSLFMLIASVAIFGTIGIFRRYTPLDSAPLAMLRGLIGSLFLLALMALRRQKLNWTAIRKNLALLLISGAVIGFNWMLLFEAYNYTTVATATLCYYMSPIFVIIASPLVFREKLTLRKLLCVFAALVGMVFVSGIIGVGFSLSELTGVFCGLGAALMYTGIVLMNKKIHDVPAMDKTVIQLFTAGIVLLPYVLLKHGFEGAEFTPVCIVMVFVMSIVHTGIGYALYFGSMDKLPAQTIAIFSYVDPIVAVVLGAAFLHEPMDALGWIGAILILGAAVLSELNGKKKSEAEE